MTMLPAGEPASRQVLRDDVYDRLLDLLMDGSLKAGDRVGIDAMARHLHVSPTPVREALANLEHTGLIERTALRGYRVAPPVTVAQLNQLIDARKAIELAAMRMAMDDPAALLPDLAESHEVDARVIAEHGLDSPTADLDFASYRAYFEADWAFHQTILQHSGNGYLARMGESLSFQAHRLRQTFGAGSLDARDALAEHQAVLDAVRRGDADEAVAVMERHLEQVRARSLHDEAGRA